jgi:hypothetical protein
MPPLECAALEDPSGAQSLVHADGVREERSRVPALENVGGNPFEKSPNSGDT